MPPFAKKLVHIKQWTSEKIGTGQKTEAGEEFTHQQQQTALRVKHVKNVHDELQEYAKSVAGKKQQQSGMERFGMALGSFGDALGCESQLGLAMSQTGSAYADLAQSHAPVVTALTEGYGAMLHRCTQNADELDRLLKKMSGQRLEYDSKAAKMRGSKQSGGDRAYLEEEARLCRERYDEAVEACRDRMDLIAQNESEQLFGLLELVDAHEAYFSEAASRFQTLKKALAPIRASVGTARPRPSSETLRSVRSARSLSRSSSADNLDKGELHAAVGAVPVAELVPESESKLRASCLRQSAPAGPIPAAPRGRSGSNSSTSTAGTLIASSVASVSPPPPPNPRATASGHLGRVRALYAFEAENEGDLALAIGDLVLVHKHVSDGWWEGELLTRNVGARGLFPSNYVSSVAPQPMSSTPAPSGARISAPCLQSTTHAGLAGAARGTTSTAPSTVAPCSTCQCSNFRANMFRPNYCSECCHTH